MEEEKLQKFEYLENEMSDSDEIKNISQFLKGYHLVKKWKIVKKWRTQALKVSDVKYSFPYFHELKFSVLFCKSNLQKV